MKFAFVLFIIIGIVALIGTVSAARTVDTNYGKSTKKISAG